MTFPTGRETGLSIRALLDRCPFLTLFAIGTRDTDSKMVPVANNVDRERTLIQKSIASYAYQTLC